MIHKGMTRSETPMWVTQATRNDPILAMGDGPGSHVRLRGSDRLVMAVGDSTRRIVCGRRSAWF
jgi:hypothetical protein